MNYALSQQAKTDEGGIANVQMLCISDMLPVQKTCNSKVETTMQTGNYPFPSSVRDVESSPSKLVDRDEILKPLEKNNFSIIDVTEHEMTLSLYT